MLLEVWAGFPTGKNGRGSYPERASHLSDKGESKSLCDLFFPPHEDMLTMAKSKKWKKSFLSTSMFDGWPCSYWPSYLYCQHASYDGYDPTQLLALSHSRVCRNNCLIWVDRK
jgi:hypothetical protein